MKKLLFVLLASLLILGNSCKKDDDLGSIVHVQVKEKGLLKSGVTVYLFSSHTGPTTDFFKPIHAKKQVVTDSKGIATFELQEVSDLNVIDTQTTLYFGVFSNDEKIKGKTSITIKKGEEKTTTINLLGQTHEIL